MKFKKKSEESQNQEVYEQDLTQQENPGGVFIMKLLFREPVGIPEKEHMAAIMEKHMGEMECFWYNEKGAGLAAKKYLSQFKDAALPPQVMITPCTEFNENEIDGFHRGQMWDCREDCDRILSECGYQVIVTDMMAAGLAPKERAQLDMDLMEAAAALYPSCEAIYFCNSGKLFTAQTIREHQIPAHDRFIKFAVNVRFFNIQGTEDMLVDTLGMGTLWLPDLQYHFHGMDPNWVVNHAYCIASYLLSEDNPIEPGDTVDGVAQGRIDGGMRWKCQYEDALIQPVREVIDINMNEYGSGRRA